VTRLSYTTSDIMRGFIQSLTVNKKQSIRQYNNNNKKKKKTSNDLQNIT
jgi:hypothetical protein